MRRAYGCWLGGRAAADRKNEGGDQDAGNDPAYTQLARIYGSQFFWGKDAEPDASMM